MYLSLSLYLYLLNIRNIFFWFLQYKSNINIIFPKFCLFYQMFSPVVSTFKSLQSFHISFFSLSLSLFLSLFISLSLSLFLSTLLRIYGRFRPCFIADYALLFTIQLDLANSQSLYSYRAERHDLKSRFLLFILISSPLFF